MTASTERSNLQLLDSGRSEMPGCRELQIKQALLSHSAAARRREP